MKKAIQQFLPILLLTLIPTLALWTPFFFGVKDVLGVPLPTEGMATVVRNYDGPLYIVVAKTLYNIDMIKNQFSFDLPVEYYAAHFPLYPLLIRGVATILPIGYLYSMLVVTVISSLLCLWFFYKLAKLYVKDIQALWLTTVFAIFPARWLIVRSVGSPEPLFLGAIIASVYYFQQKKFWRATIWGAIASITKSPGILLFVAYSAVILLPALKHAATTTTKYVFKRFEWKSFPLLLIPVSLLGVFFLYQARLGDFWAYFHSGDNIHLFFPPFQIFNYSATWVGTFWLEEVIFVYLLGLIGLMQLGKQKNYLLLAVAGIYFATLIFVSHRDLMRYGLPAVPFLIIGFRDLLLKKEFKYILAFLAIPIYLFALAYISQNHMPISDWAPLL